MAFYIPPLFWSLTATGANALYGISLFGLIVFLADTTTLGLFSWVFQAWMLIVLASSFGNQEASLILSSDPKHRPVDLWPIGIKSAWRIALLTTAASILVCTAWWVWLHDIRAQYLALLSAAIPAAVATRFILGYLNGTGQLSSYAISTIARLILGVLSTLLAFNLIPAPLIDPSRSTLFLCALLTLIEWVLFLILFLRHRPSKTEQSPITNAALKDEYHHHLRRLGGNAILAEAHGRADILIVGLILGPALTGVYSMISHLGRMALITGQPFYRLLIPTLIKNPPPDHSRRGLSSLQTAMQGSIYILMFSMSLFLASTWYFSENLNDIGLSSKTITLLIPLLIAFSLQSSIGLGASLLVSWNKQRIQLIRQAVFLIMLIPTITVSTLLFGLPGAVWSTSLAYLIYVLSIPIILNRIFPYIPTQEIFLKIIPLFLILSGLIGSTILIF